MNISKWESSGSLPDIDKIIAMSELFGVSTDYLLKDEAVIQEETAEHEVEETEETIIPDKEEFAAILFSLQNIKACRR